MGIRSDQIVRQWRARADALERGAAQAARDGAPEAARTRRRFAAELRDSADRLERLRPFTLRADADERARLGLR